MATSFNISNSPTTSSMSSPPGSPTSTPGSSSPSNSFFVWHGWDPPLPRTTSCTQTGSQSASSNSQGPTSWSWTYPSSGWTSIPKQPTSSIDGPSDPSWIDWSRPSSTVWTSPTMTVEPSPVESDESTTWTVVHTTIVSYTTIYLASAVPSTSTASMLGVTPAVVSSSSPLPNSPASASFSTWTPALTITVNPLSPANWNPASASGATNVAPAAIASYTGSAIAKPRPGYALWCAVLLIFAVSIFGAIE